MDSAAIDDPSLDPLAPARSALLDEAVAEVTARRRAAGPSPVKTGCAVCINGGRGCEGLACDAEGGHAVPPAVIRRLERCEAILAARLSLDPIDPMACNPRLSLESLHWRCERALRCAEKLPPETLGAWLGFVQGCLAMRGMIGTDDLL
jgi:hypothetical protein